MSEIQKPKYIHDCSSCKYLGTGTAPILKRTISPCFYDFYICECEGKLSQYRTIIARSGNDDDEYLSTILLGSQCFTPLDLVFLFNGIELTKPEESRVLKILITQWKNNLGMADFRNMSTGVECSFGGGNIFWKD
jgi:hypothetical protein